MTPLDKATDGMSVREAAERMGVTTATIRNWIRAGRLPVTRFGPPGQFARIRIDEKDLDDLRHST